MRPALDIALAASARAWPDRVHRHVLDHGGARVTGRLMGATQCLETAYDVLFVDDVCSFLSPRLVSMLREDGRVVVGVYERDDGPDAKRRLLECGISDVIEADASPDEFLARAFASVEIATLLPPRPAPHPDRGRVVGVAGVTTGTGATEVAVGLGFRLVRRVESVLVDLDPDWPSVAQRLDMAPHPNLLTLVDLVLHEGEVGDAMSPVEGLGVVGGAGWRGERASVPPYEVGMAIDALRAVSQVVIGDLGVLGRVFDEIMDRVDALVVVARGDPVGVTRLMREAPHIRHRAETTPTAVVVNMCPRRRYHRGEIADEVVSALSTIPVVLVPRDRRVEAAGWEGVPAHGGRFAREVGRMADLVAGWVSR